MLPAVAYPRLGFNKSLPGMVAPLPRDTELPLCDIEAWQGSQGAHDRLAGSAYHQVKTHVFCLWCFREVLHVVPRRCPRSR